MDGKKVGAAIAVGGALFLSLFLIQSVLTSGGSALSKFFLYFSIGGAVAGFLSPKVGIYFIIVAGFYLDLMKRFLVIEGLFSFIDLVQILAFAPVSFAGVLFGQCIKCLFTKGSFGRKEAVAFVVSVVVSALVLSISVIQKGLNVRAIAEAGSQAAYISFVWLAFYYLRTSEQRHNYFRFTLIWFVPVVIYAYKQLIFGYSDLEYRYALSGLTIVDNPLLEGRIEYYRIFSTMSSSGAYGLMTIIIGSYALLSFSDPNKGKVFLAKLFGLLCYASLIPGAGRTGWAVVLIVVLCTFMFRKTLTTLTVYGAAAALLLVLFLNGDALIETGSETVSGIADNAWEARSLQVGTFTARTESIKNWTTDPSYFSWFGLSDEEKKGTFIHDMLGEIYVGYGLVGLVSAVGVMISLLYFSHRKILRTRSVENRLFMAFLLAVIFGLLMGSIVSGGGIRIFPVVFHFWAFVGMLCVMIFSTEKLPRGEEKLLLQ